MITQFQDDVDTWISTYIRLMFPQVAQRGRGMLVVRVIDGECMPTFDTLASCNDENLSKFGANHEEAEVMRTVIRCYDDLIELPVLTVGEKQGDFRFELKTLFV